MICDEHIVFNAGRTFLPDHFAGRNARVALLRPKRLTLGAAVANLAEKQNIKMAFPLFEELWKLMHLLVRKDFRQANLGGPGFFVRHNKLPVRLFFNIFFIQIDFFECLEYNVTHLGGGCTITHSFQERTSLF